MSGKSNLHELHLDFESRSAVDLKKAGVYVYAESPTTSVLCAAFSFPGDNDVSLWVPGDPVPARLGDHVQGGGTVVAHNAAFERIIWRDIMGPRYGWPVPRTDQFRCTMVEAMAMALPGSLDLLGEALGLAHQKDSVGSALMLKMCKPRKRRKSDPEGGEDAHGLLWHEDPADLERLYEYCRQDVRTEMAADRKLISLRPSERQLWLLDQTINDRGIGVDETLARRAIKAIDIATAELNRRMELVTGGEVKKVSEVAKIKDFVEDHGYPTDSLAKDVLAELLKISDLPPAVEEVLELRQEGGKASVAKIQALLKGKSADGRARGLLQFHAASTGRWAGRRFQPHNIKRPERKGEISQAIDDLLALDADTFLALYDQPLTSISDCIRGMVIAAPGKRIIARDYSNIEGRVLAWLGGEKEKLAAFRRFDAGDGPDIYKITAALILGKTPAEISDDERQAYGKVPELALGYQGGVGAFQNMARVYRVRVTDAEADEIKKGWRARHPGISALWRAYEDAAFDAVDHPGETYTVGTVVFVVKGRFLWCRLPSGRSLAYANPEIREKAMPWIDPETGKKARKLSVSYMGVNSYTRKWQREYIYGGKWAENITSATARDIMADSMVRLEDAGYPTVLSVHDELVCEADADRIDEAEFDRLVTELPAYATGLPIAVGGFVAERYRK